MKLSIIIPAYNEEAGIATFHSDILLPAIQKLKHQKITHEIIYVNDGSKDETLSSLQKIAKKYTNVKIINLSRNFGKEIALSAGISQATGDALIMMDADGQHPPKIIPEFIKKWKQGAQVVIGVRTSNQKEGFVKRYGSKLFYKLFNKLSGASIVPQSTDYRLIDRAVQKEFIKFKERQRISRGIIDWLGFEREYIHFDAPARLAGEASYSTRQLFKLAVNSIISLSLRPLRLLVWIGIFITNLALISGTIIIVEQFILGDPLQWNFTGSAILGVFTSLLVGIVLTSEGIIAIYLSHIYEQTQDRPLFVIDYKNSIGIDETTA